MSPPINEDRGTSQEVDHVLCFCTDHLDQEKQGLGAVDRKVSETKVPQKKKGKKRGTWNEKDLC